LFDEGLTLAAAARIVGLQDELDLAHNRIEALENRPEDPTGTAEGPAGP
ncbi:MAG: hypothetical protein QOG20_5670, partial [Pseudonocardiales bacterium]|nr:hypothetical protein [Pseudonocardiales bacterium]